MPHGHEPVLAAEVLDLLDPRPGEVVVDCTVGRGGHALLLRDRVLPGGRLIGLDRDPRNLAYARERLGDEADLRHANFGDLRRELGEDAGRVDVLLADFGVSTNQLLTSDYGLSFADAEAPLDMRLDPDLPDTAADLLSHWPEKRIADTIFELAGERYSRRIARKLVERRKGGQGRPHDRRAGGAGAAVRAASAEAQEERDRPGDADVHGPADGRQRRAGRDHEGARGAARRARPRRAGGG